MGKLRQPEDGKAACSRLLSNESQSGLDSRVYLTSGSSPMGRALSPHWPSDTPEDGVEEWPLDGSYPTILSRLSHPPDSSPMGSPSPPQGEKDGFCPSEAWMRVLVLASDSDFESHSLTLGCLVCKMGLTTV